jgi:hypothetical protein
MQELKKNSTIHGCISASQGHLLNWDDGLRKVTEGKNGVEESNPPRHPETISPEKTAISS